MNKDEDKIKEGFRNIIDPEHKMSDEEWEKVYQTGTERYARQQALSSARTVFKYPLFGGFFAGCISMAAGNGIGWICLHALCNWFYVAYKFAFLFFGGN